MTPSPLLTPPAALDYSATPAPPHHAMDATYTFGRYEMRTATREQAERCRAAIAAGVAVRGSLELIITTLSQALDGIDAAIAAHIEAHQPLADAARLLQSLKGVGPVTAHTMLGELPELGRLTGKEIAALAGLVPRTRQSGTRTWRATTGHGRPGVRRVLFNAARCAIRWNPPMKAFYQRLVVQNRRPGKVALVAVMRKMLVILNAIARDKKPWAYQET